MGKEIFPASSSVEAYQRLQCLFFFTYKTYSTSKHNFTDKDGFVDRFWFFVSKPEMHQSSFMRVNMIIFVKNPPDEI